MNAAPELAPVISAVFVCPSTWQLIRLRCVLRLVLMLHALRNACVHAPDGVPILCIVHCMVQAPPARFRMLKLDLCGLMQA